MTGHVLEIVSFKLVPGTGEEQFRALAENANRFIARQPGFLNRRLVAGEDGVWVDVIEWRSLKEAHAAAQKLMAEPSLTGFLTAIDMGSIAMSHRQVMAAA